MTMQEVVSPRRDVKSRESAWAPVAARWLRQRGATPNQVSIASAGFAAAAGGMLVAGGHAAPGAGAGLWAGSVAMIVGRLLCNLFDGMIAVEGGLKTKSGEIYNDFPDRPSDLFVLVGAGYALPFVAGAAELGWLAGCLAVMTAYVRLLGGAAGARQYFAGPMAKQHRMAVMNASILVAAAERVLHGTAWALVAGLAIVAAGSLVTVVRRLRLVVTDLESK